MRGRVRMKKVLAALLTVLVTTTASAAKFKGYAKRSPSAEPMVLKEKIMRLNETPTDFLLTLSRHAALYKFPKMPQTDSEARSFLKSRVKSKSVLSITIDPMTAEILYIEDMRP